MKPPQAVSFGEISKKAAENHVVQTNRRDSMQVRLKRRYDMFQKKPVSLVLAFACAVAAEMLATSGLELIDWEASWAESGTSMAVAMVAAAVLALSVALAMKSKSKTE